MQHTWSLAPKSAAELYLLLVLEISLRALSSSTPPFAIAVLQLEEQYTHEMGGSLSVIPNVSTTPQKMEEAVVRASQDTEIVQSKGPSFSTTAPKLLAARCTTLMGSMKRQRRWECT